MPWQVVANSVDMAVHAVLLPTGNRGRILYFGGYLVEDTHIYDIEDEQVLPVGDPEILPYNAFCSGHAFLADGRVLVAGGQLRVFDANGNEIPAPPPPEPGEEPPPDAPHAIHGGMGWGGERRCSIFLPRAERWEEVTPMHLDPAGNPDSGGRWYPTLVTLANGDVLAVGGHPDLREHYPDLGSHRHANNIPERYNAGSNSWTLLGGDPPLEEQTTNVASSDYQRTHLLPNGRVFFANPVRGRNRVYDPFQGLFVDDPIVDLPADEKYHDVSAAWTSVMLPLLHQENFRPRVVLMGGATAERIDLGAGNPEWQPTGPRDWSGTPPIRNFACPVILPTGEILLLGGCEDTSDPDPDDPPSLDEIRQESAVTRVEVYDPGISWQNGAYSPGTGSWQTLPESEAAEVPRHYHSTALLMPNGAVWTAGSNGPGPGGGNELRIEVFEPWYFQGGRPTISDCPPSIGYAFPFLVETPQADSIARVALVRCGSVTHSYNPDQRYLSVAFEVVGDDTLRVQAPAVAADAPPGYYMLWVIDEDGLPCEQARFIRLCQQKPFITADVSTFSIFEVQALGTPAHFDDALYLVYEGFLPDEVEKPDVEIRRPDNSLVPGMVATVGAAHYEGDPQNNDVAQRIVFPCRITFESQDAFDDIPAADDFQDVVFRAQMRDFPSQTTLTLSKNPNPRMRDGNPHWLSIDLRAFTTTPDTAFTAGVEHGAGLNAPYDYIQAVLQAYNSLPANGHPFDALPTSQANNPLPLYSQDANGNNLFNYAVARVRFVAPEGVDAADVRVFFRLWTTGWGSMEFSTNVSYRRSGSGPDAAPLLGLIGGEINTIPCFAEPRVANMEQQTDETNRRTIAGAGGIEVLAYFGCWLDFNQDVKRFPLNPVGNGPYQDDLRSIQELMRGLHQCLVAEIHYQLDPIAANATPSSSDNLAQRNLLLDESDNPGGFAGHIVHHTFEIKPSPMALQLQPLPASSSLRHRLHPDELVIDWGNLPRDSHVTFYLPQVDAEQVVRYAGLRQGPVNLARSDPHTIHCKVSDVGFIPIPGPLQTTLPGLMSIQLPPNVTAGQQFTVVVRQVDGRRLRVIGTFQFTITVSTADTLLPRLTRNLAVLKHIALAIPQSNRWYPVFERYLGQLGDRVRALGGDPDAVKPSPTGGDPKRDEPPAARHERYEGKICHLLYDCFGDFEGFVLEGCDERRHFRACERAIEELVRRACHDRSRVTVFVRPEDRARPVQIAIGCC
jgi:hypothetical protein